MILFDFCMHIAQQFRLSYGQYHLCASVMQDPAMFRILPKRSTKPFNTASDIWR